METKLYDGEREIGILVEEFGFAQVEINEVTFRKERHLAMPEDVWEKLPEGVEVIFSSKGKRAFHLDWSRASAHVNTRKVRDGFQSIWPMWCFDMLSPQGDVVLRGRDRREVIKSPVDVAILTEERLRQVVEEFMEFDAFTFDVETMGEFRGDPRRNDVFWLALGGPGVGYAIPMGHPTGPKQLSKTVVFEHLRPLFFNVGKVRRKVNHNVVFDLISVAKYFGEMPPGPYCDTQMCVHLDNENTQGQQKLDECVFREFKFRYAKLGRTGVEKESFRDAALYSYLDARYDWLLYDRKITQLKPQGLLPVLRLECDVLKSVLEMETTGIDVDEVRLRALDQELVDQRAELQERLDQLNGAPFNQGSPQQRIKFVYDKRGHPVTKLTKGGQAGQNKQPSTDADTLELLAADPAIQLMLDYADVSKLHSTYVIGLLEQMVDGKLYADFVPHGTKTGRFSCVAGDTLLETSRGIFRFDEYMPVEGDLVRTHLGRWRPIVRKIYKGLDRMYRVCLATGATLTCTAEHRVLTPDGWVYVGLLQPGDEVLSYVGFDDVRRQQGQQAGGLGGVLGRRQAHDQGNGGSVGHDVSERPRRLALRTGPRQVEGRAGAPVFTLQDRGAQPYARQEWFPAPQLQGGCGRRAWLSAAQGGGSLRARASSGDGGCSWCASLGSVEAVRCASHRRGPSQQCSGQSGFGDGDGAQGFAPQTTTIAEVIPLGVMGVWDVEVEEDHSYLAHGFINHNCRAPNLQNIPRVDDIHAERGQLIRQLFMAPPGYQLVVGDYSQVELRVLAHFSQDPLLLKAYREELDLHMLTAQRAYGVASPKPEQRALAKNVNFAMVYGAGPRTIMARYKVPERVAAKLVNAFFTTYVNVPPWTEAVVKDCRRQRPPMVKTIAGRRRRLPEMLWGDRELRGLAERQAVNTVIQGSAADICKMAMVDVTEKTAGTPVKMVLTVHDEIVLIAPDHMAEDTVVLLRETMEAVGEKLKLLLPLKADVHCAKRWSDAKQ